MSRESNNISRQSTPWQVRLWRRVDIGWDYQCWEWSGASSSRGYGLLNVGDKRLRQTHRLAYEFFNGPIPVGMVVRHACDNPPCCNPAHLLIGTQAENLRDAVARGRIARGRQNASTKLSDEQVRQIRRRFNRRYRRHSRGWASNRRELAQEYGVGAHYLSAVARGRLRGDV